MKLFKSISDPTFEALLLTGVTIGFLLVILFYQYKLVELPVKLVLYSNYFLAGITPLIILSYWIPILENKIEKNKRTNI